MTTLNNRAGPTGHSGVRNRVLGPSALRDDELVAAVAENHEEALAELWCRHGGAVYTLGRHLCGRERAETLAYEVFLALWQRTEDFDPTTGSLRTYLLLQVHDRAVDARRGDKAPAAREARSSVGGARPGHVKDDAFGGPVADAISEALAVLPWPSRQAVLLTFFVGLTYQQLGVLLRRPEATVKRQVLSGVAELRQRLGHDEARAQQAPSSGGRGDAPTL